MDDLVAAGDLVVSIFEKGIIPCAIEFMDNYSINCVADYLASGEILRRAAEALVLVEVDGHHEEAVNNELNEVIQLARIAIHFKQACS
jgi:glycolate oxidase